MVFMHISFFFLCDNEFFCARRSSVNNERHKKLIIKSFVLCSVVSFSFIFPSYIHIHTYLINLMSLKNPSFVVTDLEDSDEEELLKNLLTTALNQSPKITRGTSTIKEWMAIIEILRTSNISLP
ncbi:unnamed protein product [Absidia cylindrospora]